MPTSPQSKERPLHSLLSRSLVNLYIGPTNTHWILHEKLLCHRSAFFRRIFNPSGAKPSPSAYGLPDEDEAAFTLFVNWLYSQHIPPPAHERDIGALLELYFMAEKWEIAELAAEVVTAVRKFYRDADSWPSLRRVQYVCANTERANGGRGKEGVRGGSMRELMVGCVARMVVVGRGEGGGGGKKGVEKEEGHGKKEEGLAAHWEGALREDAGLAVDVLLCIGSWRVDGDAVPDVRIEGGGDEQRGERGEMEEQGEDAKEEEDRDDELLDWGAGFRQRQTEMENE